MVQRRRRAVKGVRGFPVRPAIDRFMERVEKPDGDDGCWLWTGATTKPPPHSYGRFAPAKGVLVLAHRWSYEHFVGPIPEGLTIDHLCRVRLCVNPAHLEPVTGLENQRRGLAAKSTCVNGHPYTPENVMVERSTGRRRCIICTRETKRRWMERHRSL